jgi:hypothetical protein
MQYRITDYNTTTVQTNTQSAGHQFDIIVVADDSHTLNENASAARHAGDTYFSDSTLEAWELKYNIDNDTDKYEWADSGATGRGVIYWMKDEWNNECPYDFKNIQFKVGAKTQPGTVADVFYYTFSIATGTNDATVTDHSLNGVYCYGNKMGVYMNSSKQTLPFNIFRNTSTTSKCYSNTFGNSCSSNTFGNYCYSNTFGDECYSNTFGHSCLYNTFGNYCGHNTFGGVCNENTFGSYCGNNTFGNSCISNTFGDSCGNNTFGNNCSTNTFGGYCGTNTFGTFFNNNTLGASVRYFITGNATGVTSSAQTKDYIQYLIVENGVQYVNAYCTGTTSQFNQCKNVKISLGLKGKSSSYLQIDITPQIGATASVTYQPTNSQIISI